MTTPDAPSGAPAQPEPGRPRAKRPTPARNAPRRGYGPEPAAPASTDAAAGAASASEAIAQAVRLGYSVIGENIAQGREAASAFRAGDYRPDKATEDLKAVASRMLQLTRELSTLSFDVLERLVQDPAARGGGAPASPPPAPTGGDPATRPAPGPFQAGDPPAGPVEAAKAPAPQATPHVELTCSFSGGRAVLKAGALSRPDTPVFLVVPALTAIEPGPPTITGEVTFTPAASGDGLVANIKIPEGQPPGLYSGVICVWDTGIPMGMLTIEVLA